MGLFGKKERDEAIRLGMAIAEVEREIPEFLDDGGISLERDKCVRYSLPRKVKAGAAWALLQRTEEMGATLPNQYLLEASEPLSLEAEKRLREIAGKFDEEYFEFEGTASDVAVYWLEWGGADKVRELHAALERISSV